MGWLKSWVVLASCGVLFGSDETIQPKFDASAETAAAELKKKILAEVERLGSHDWAGEYYHGDGLGVNVSLCIAPENGYVFEWHGCLGVYDRNYGAVTESDGKIRLTFTFPNKQEGFQGIAEEFVSVQWGNRRYLIPADEMVGFCNEVNSGSEPRKDLHGFYLLRRGDEKKSVSGRPTVPDQFSAYLLEEPVTASIVNIDSAKKQPADSDDAYLPEIVVVLDKGSDARLLPGMELHVVKPRNAFGSMTVHGVDKGTAEGTLRYFRAGKRKPEVGWKVSTRRR